MLRATLTVISLLATTGAAASGQSPAPQRPLYAFFVIGPDTGAVRSRASEWIAEELMRVQARDSISVWPWRQFLESALDVTIGDGPWDQPPEATSGPRVDADSNVRYPW